MQKFLKTKNLGNMKVLVCSAVFAAISIICGKFLAISIGDTIRISFENTPIILSGFCFGPVVGLLTGLVADIVGCILRGYAINPLITLASVFIGFAAGAIFSLLHKANLNLKLFISVVVCHAVGSVVIKTVGLFLMYGTPFLPTLLARTVNYIIVALAEFLILKILLRNRAVTHVLRAE